MLAVPATALAKKARISAVKAVSSPFFSVYLSATSAGAGKAVEQSTAGRS